MELEAILLAGPTASGKSRLAMDLARRHDGVVINADSMQVYRELRILTARPSPSDEAAVPHRLYGCVPAAERHSVGRWRDLVVQELTAARLAGRVAIITGGTGLYFRALTAGLAEIPRVPDSVRQDISDQTGSMDSPALHRLLSTEDPEGAARLRPSDRARLLRALEVVRFTGRSLTSWQEENDPSPPLPGAGSALRLVLMPERSILHRRIAERVEQMAANGALGEVEALMGLGLDPDLPVMKAIGVRELGAHLRGETSLDAALTDMKTATRRYAKRQMTWFRNQMPDWRFVVAAGEALDLPFAPA
jgi:tRNA dimethylallyltransferase